MIKQLLSVEEVIDEANLPADVEDCLGSTDDTEVYELINRFYNIKGEINPEEYEISYDNTKKTIKSTLGRPVSEELQIDEIRALQMFHSHYSDEGLKMAGIDRKNSWNGDMAGIQYDEGELEILKSDYYTTASFGEIPYVESAHCIQQEESYDEVDLKDLTLRNKHMKSRDDVERTKWLASGGSVGGTIIANTGNEWKIILGRRSSKTRLNAGRVSTVPNGGIRYDNITENGFLEDLKLHFNEELFRGQRDPGFFEEYVDPYRCSAGWNLRDLTLSIGYTLLIEDPDGYQELIDKKNHNFEFETLMEIDVNNPSRIVSNINIESASPSIIPMVYRSLGLFDNIVEGEELDYTIESL